MRIAITILLVVTYALCRAQNFCDVKSEGDMEQVDYRSVILIAQQNIIDSVSYNGVFICPDTKAKIYGNMDKRGRKNGWFTIYKADGSFYANGEFLNNKKSGWWWYGGCCRTLYKHGKEKRTVCALF